MINKKIISLALVGALLTGAFTTVYSADVSYLPYVNPEMSEPSFWTGETELLMTEDEIQSQNMAVLAEKATCMNDLKNQPQSVDGVALNEAVRSSTTADAKYYLGWTYLSDTTLATMEDFNPIIENTQNPAPLKEQPVRYAVAVKSTALRTFPSELALWDDPKDADLDYQYLVNIRVNEPVVITSVSNDGKYYLAKNICCSGWIPAEDVALCKNRDEWLSAWDLSSENAMIVYGDKVYTEFSVTGKDRSALLLTMGTVLELVRVNNPDELIDNRAAYQNYVVYVPVRNADGTYAKRKTLISEHQKVYAGYMPLTKSNIAKVAFSSLGNTYGWGGSLNSDDCSGYIRNIYKCFGLELARNTTWQSAMPVAGQDMKGMCREERTDFISGLPFGSVLYFNGHEMLYLGSVSGRHYVISSVGSIVLPFEGAVRQRIRSVVINTLDIKRASGVSWLDDITYVNVPYLVENDDNKKLMPALSWHYEGVKFCIDNKYMNGSTDGFFYPSDAVTKAELMQIVFNMAGKPSSGVASSEIWYGEAAHWAAQNGILPDENFASDAGIAATRRQTVEILYRYALHKGYNASVENGDVMLSSFEDAKGMSKEADRAFSYAVDRGIIKGNADNKLNPEGNITRGELAAVIQRFALNNK